MLVEDLFNSICIFLYDSFVALSIALKYFMLAGKIKVESKGPFALFLDMCT